MNIATYQKASARTLNSDLEHAHQCTVYGLGFVDEAVELMALFFDPAQVSRSAIIKEAGDVYWYAAALATRHDILLATTVDMGYDACHQQDLNDIWDNMALSAGVVMSAKNVGEQIKKAYGHDHPLNRIELARNVGAVLYILNRLLERHAIAPEEVMEANVEKLMKRYPGGFSAEDSMARVDEMPKKCAKCNGEGKVANTDDQEPWSCWADLPPGSDLAVRMGLVVPVNCPECEGKGHD